MGGCASKPKDLDSQQAPLPAETPGSPRTVEVEAETVPQENNNGGDAKKEEPLVDLSEPAPDAPKVEETSTETKLADGAVVSEESKPSETSEVASKPAEEKVEAADEANELPEEEKKEVADAVAEKPAEDKKDAPLVQV